jgi:long-chain acyl-CoA synthetase
VFTSTPPPARLHALLCDSAARDPDAPVFIDRGVATRYAELDARSDRIAAGLRELGVCRGQRVALVMDARVEYAAAYYGVMKAGAAVVPLCSDTRPHTLGRELADCEASVVILEADNAVHLLAIEQPLPALRHAVLLGASDAAPRSGLALHDFDALERCAAPAQARDADASGAELASIVYTSGTTGRPRGVMLSHANLVANVRSIVQYLELDATDRVAMVLPFYYVYGNSVLHTHIAAGASIALAGNMAFPKLVLENIAQQRCTGLSGVPATFARLLSVRDLERHDLSSLRYLTQAGAGMAPAQQLLVQRRFPRARLFVMYGMTEAAARLTYLPPERLEQKLGSVGIPIPGVEIRIVDAQGRELPRGSEGELCVRGDNVMLGYWNDPEHSAQALRPEGLRTGDLGRMDADGFIHLTGRQSEMIKSGAHRISPREIEEVIETLPGVTEVAAVGVPDPLLGEAIVAFVVLAPGAALDSRRVLHHCHGRLPRFKLPREVRLVDGLPHTATGKLQRRALVEGWVLEHSSCADRAPKP